MSRKGRRSNKTERELPGVGETPEEYKSQKPSESPFKKGLADWVLSCGWTGTEDALFRSENLRFSDSFDKYSFSGEKL